MLTEDRRYHHVQFQFVKAFTRGLTYPLDFLGQRRGQAFRDLLGNGSVRQRFGKDADDIGFPCGKRQHPFASSPHQNGRMGPLSRFGKSIEVRDRVLVAGEGEWPVGKESLEDLDGLLQAAHAHSCRFKNHPGLLVLGPEPARPNPKLESSTGEEIERRRFFRQHHRMPVIIVEHQGSHSEGPGGVGRSH